MYTRAAKGEKGEQGEQGQAGKPCNKCVCSYRNHGIITARYIVSGGSRSLKDDDLLVIVDAVEKCKFFLPPVVIDNTECNDMYYCPIQIRIIVHTGMHSITSRNGKINDLFTTFDIDKRKEYLFVSKPSGEWLVL